MDRYCDTIGTSESNKRNFPDHQDIEDEDDNPPQPQPKRSCFVTEAVITTELLSELFSAESRSVIEASVRSVVHEVLDSKIQSHFHSSPSSSRKTQLNDQAGGAAGSGTLKLKLCFLNQMPSTIFTSNEIEAKDGQALQVALVDASNSNAIVQTGPLASAQVEIVVLEGHLGSSQQKGTFWSVSDFNKSVLYQREGKRPLIVGHDMTLSLKQGVGLIRNLSFTDNSRWTRSGKFKLGARIRDPKILVQFSRITEAISEPFKVRDHRGEVNKKQHPPNMRDEVWRLEGIGKGGVYHSRLSAHNITTVYDFLKAYQTNSSSLKQLLGNKVPNKTWKAMVRHASECVIDYKPLYASNGHCLLENHDAMKGEAYRENLEVGEQTPADGDGFSQTLFSNQQFDPFMRSNPSPDLQSQHLDSIFRDPPVAQEASTSYHLNSFMLQEDTPLVQEASISYHHNRKHGVVNTTTSSRQYYQATWTELAPKP